MGDAHPAYEIRISQNGYARGWWEVVSIFARQVVAEGIGRDPRRAREQANDAIEIHKSAWKLAG
jgi:hypothetical protein